jgi:hypothetical protein
MESAIMNMSEGLAPDGCLTLKESTMTRFVREEVQAPQFFAVVSSKDGHMIVDHKDAPGNTKAIDMNGNLLLLLRTVEELQRHGQIRLSPYAIFTPDYDAKGFIAEEYGDDGLVKKNKKGKPVLKTVDLSVALREADNGERTIKLAYGFDHPTLKCKTYKLNVLRQRKAVERAPSHTVETFDMAAYFMAKTSKKK